MTTTALHIRTSPTTPGRRAALHAFAWTAAFIVWHGCWALGGDFGFGDREASFPDTTSSLAGWSLTAAVMAMFAAGLAVPLAIARGAGPRRLLAGLMWAGAAVLSVRGAAGLLDDGLRFGGLAETGISGLSDEEVLGTADPSAYTIWSSVGMDAFFAFGGLLFARAARAVTRALPPRGARRGRRLPSTKLAWAPYAAFGWAAAYAIGVRGYQASVGPSASRGPRGPVRVPPGRPAGRRLPAARGHRRPRLRPPVGAQAPELAHHRPGARGLGVRDGARADRLRDQAAAPARRHRDRVPGLDAIRRDPGDLVGPVVLRAVVPRARRAGHAGCAAPSPGPVARAPASGDWSRPPASRRSA